MLNLLDVIWIYDDLIRPPHPKMVVCMSPEDGWFYRINSKPHIKPCVAIERSPHHEFLEHDSFLQCSVLELDDYIIDMAVDRRGVIGAISPHLKNEIIRAIMQGRETNQADKARMCGLLNDLD